MNWFWCITLGLLIYNFFTFTKRPKVVRKQLECARKVPANRDRYNPKKIPEGLDAIIIGSGIGGLSCGAFLSRYGKKVLVLEQHTIAGGCTHSYSSHGIEHETGVHYVGNLGGLLDLITDEPIKWTKMGQNSNDFKDVYDEFYIEGRHYTFTSGETNFINELLHIFPEEREVIHRYVALVKQVAKLDLFIKLKIVRSLWLQNFIKWVLLQTSYGQKWLKYVTNSAHSVISGLTNNKELISVLTAQFGDYGLTPKQGNFYIHSCIAAHYLKGGYFPTGGTGEIAKAIIPTIEKSGGRVLVGKAVTEILMNADGQCIGVLMDNGDRIYCNTIISAVGAKTTCKLLQLDFPRVIKFKEVVSSISRSTSFVYLFVNLDGSPEELGLRSSNIWIHPNHNHDLYKFHFEDKISSSLKSNQPLSSLDEVLEELEIPMFISSSSARDSLWAKRYPDKSNLTILFMVNPEWFKERGDNYELLKDIFAKHILTQVYQYYPKIKDKVEHYEVGTPLSNEHYIGVKEAYGLTVETKRFLTELRPDTGINGLYLTGQDIVSPGFAGALGGGVVTAHVVLGYGGLLDLLTGKNMLKDLKINASC